jgi:hypothetical protein
MAFVGQCLRPLTRTLQRLPFLQKPLPSPSVVTPHNCFNSEARCRFLKGTSSPMVLRSATIAVETDINPLLSIQEFPKYDQVKSEHVGPGIRKLIQESEKRLIDLEKDLTSLGENVKASQLLVRLELVSDSLSRAWSTCSHLKAGNQNLSCFRHCSL